MNDSVQGPTAHMCISSTGLIVMVARPRGDDRPVSHPEAYAALCEAEEAFLRAGPGEAHLDLPVGNDNHDTAGL
jgi:hypothetical protein